jgi:hypothetical protein
MENSYSIIDLLELTCKGLDERKIEYMISGSIAMSIYSDNRNTRDIDLVVNLKKEDVDSFLEIYKAGFFYSKEHILKDVESKSMFNIISTTTAYKIDFMVKKDTEFRNLEFNRKTKHNIMNRFDAWVVSLEDLIISKLIWIQELESEIQKRDIKELLRVSNPDEVYLNHWIKKLNLKTYSII